MRVLHLIESLIAPPPATTLELARRTIALLDEHDHEVCAIGPSALVEEIESMGLRTHEHIPAPLHSVWMAGAALRRRLRRTPQRDLIQAWTVEAARIAAAAGIGPVLATIPHPPIRPRPPWPLRSAGGGWRRTDLRLLTISPTVLDELRGAAPASTAEEVIEPTVEASRLSGADRTRLRLSWGVNDDAAAVIALLADPPQRLDAMLGTLSVGLVAETGRPVHVLVGARATGVGRTRRMLRWAERERLLIVDTDAERPWRVLGGCDAALVLGEGLSAAWAMAAVLPIVAADTPSLRRFLHPDDSGDAVALFGRDEAPGDLARYLCRLIDDPRLAESLARAAQRSAQRRFSAHPWAARMRELYDRWSSGRGARPMPVADTRPNRPRWRFGG